MRVLVVDDDPGSRLVLADAIEEMGYEVETAADGRLALVALKRVPAQVVIADWMMPNMDGIELCKAVRRTAHDRSYTYVILLSSKEAKEDRLVGLSAGADDFMTKPLDHNELVARMGVARRIIRMESALRDANAELEMKRSNELEIGSHIQRALLMARPPEGTRSFDISAMNLPSSQIDGDFFDFFVHQPEIADVFVGDAMGKGIPAALVGAGVKSYMLRSMSTLLAVPNRTELPQPVEIVQSVHDGLSPELIRLGTFVTMIYARLDGTTNTATIVDCGHTKVIHWCDQEQIARTIDGKHFPIGFTDDEQYSQQSVKFDIGDVFVFYSDGVTEAKSPSGELYGETRLIEVIRNHPHKSPGHLLFRLREAVRAHTSNLSLDDDFTCVIVRIGKANERWEFEDASFSSSLGSLEAVRQFVGGTSVECGLGEAEVDALQIAVHEAVTNVVRHAHQNEPGRSFELRAERLSDGIQLSVVYEGPAFSPAIQLEPDLSDFPESGLGLFIIQQSVDTVEYFEDVMLSRNVIRMVKRRA
jgi:serine phosphatase RsbU (regulator of sigma subunit)/anti-sigma regulatory factor (Ser/Thr protein kinase)